MNKAKAYRRLRKRSDRLRQCWEESDQQLQSTGKTGAIHTEFTELEDMTTASSVKEKHNHLLRLRRSQPLKALLSNSAGEPDHLDSKEVDFFPSIQPCFSAAKSVPEKSAFNIVQTTGYVKKLETSWPMTADGNLLKLAQFHPNPIKRKASRSYSSCSSSLQVKKLTVNGNDKENGASETSSMEVPTLRNIKFPTASKMRQLLQSDNKHTESVGECTIMCEL